jgi:hypothetical protein
MNTVHVQYPKKIRMRFIVKKPSIHIAGNFVGLLVQICRSRKKAKGGKKGKELISRWPCLLPPSPPPPQKKTMNEIHQTVWNSGGNLVT